MKFSAPQKEQILGEAYFLGGYYHFKLLTLFEQIIIRDDIVTPGTLDKALATRPKAWDLFLEDFNTTANKLSFEIQLQDYGRVNKGAALGYIGKAYTKQVILLPVLEMIIKMRKQLSQR